MYFLVDTKCQLDVIGTQLFTIINQNKSKNKERNKAEVIQD